jgi:hypothetical protein
MANYGPNGGVIPFTGYTPTLGVSDAINDVTSGQIQFSGITQDDGRLSKILRSSANRVVRELFITLLGAATGATALETRARVQAQQGISVGNMALGGIVPIEVQTLINRATTTLDLTNTIASITRTTGPLTYAADVSGNGGGNKAGW